MSAKLILLAHGVLGFGHGAPMPPFVNYFNGVGNHLRRQGHVVEEPSVNPIGSIAQRGGQLAAAILAVPPGRKVHILAHSMGGLDARHAITNVPGVSARVATLVTIGTPHRGSRTADAVARRTPPLFDAIPPVLVEQLQNNAGALDNLTSEFAGRFDDNTPDVAGVRYMNVAGDASRGGHELFFFQLAAAVGGLTGEINDGVVTRASALRAGHEHLADWPVDHAGEVGWSFQTPLPIVLELPLVPSPPHFARYDALVELF